EARQQDRDLAVMFLDLDRFKNINDKYGHNSGDVLLQQVVERLKGILSPNCTLARWGGDEFTLLMPDIEQIDVAEAEARRILRVMDPPFEVRNHELYVSASIGIASFRKAGLIADAETLVRHADVALYKAKAGGRNAYSVYDPDHDKTRLMDPELERDLRHALEREQFRVVYQPQMNVMTGTLDGVEALLRWHHPQMGLISPGIFIPIAEERGWIVDIGEWVLRTACAQSRTWQEAGLPALTVAVNLSAKQFREPRLVETVAHILAETGLDARYLELEITESLAIEDMQFTAETLQRMSQLGIRLAIDDFGTGHSSLNRLQTLPLNSLKIDRSFVNDLTRNAKTSHIVFAIVALGKSLGLSLVAEGVETPEQLKFLRDIKCEIAQGYYFHKPLPPDEVGKLLQQQDIPATA
ncbi:MAG: bifunctional diguanylate cyclase/phosphodiesterase, partial [Cyanobacteria bacterium P01_H01_bin.121]